MSQRKLNQPPLTPEREREIAEARAELLRLAKEQGAKPAETFEELLGDGGPEDETANDMIRTIYGWRKEDLSFEPRSYD